MHKRNKNCFLSLLLKIMYIVIIKTVVFNKKQNRIKKGTLIKPLITNQDYIIHNKN